jgi:hypothetical protein
MYEVIKEQDMRWMSAMKLQMEKIQRVFQIPDKLLALPQHLHAKIILCKICIAIESLPLSGRRWAKRARKKGWRRRGENWYCPDCVNKGFLLE